MPVNLDRFRGPTAADELAYCNGPCGQQYHYTALDDLGLCWDCRDESDEDLNQPNPNANHEINRPVLHQNLEPKAFN